MNTEKLLIQGLKELDLSCSDEQIRSFMTFLAELNKWNRAYNLTALRTDEDIIIKHFLDSLLYIKALPEGALQLADAGTGAGFPGIPIKIIRPEINITLIESSRKKSSFLRHIIRTLRLANINVLEQRFERLGKEHERAYDVIVSRATFSVKEFLKTACPFVRKGGRLVLNKGPKVSEELKESDVANAVMEILKLRLPVKNDERNLVILECTEKQL
ncbi:MAG: 16S rRNA (guanine(527)-N(7))-methyltransferase RsmG [Nitrospirae bacterium]|nr:16S rRNA (guanine(527)-N(7))-methyltransferase RsmG [Nitrospirota bacterium]